MKKLLLTLLCISFVMSVHAQDLYCGDYNGKPAYVDADSIRYKATKSNYWEVTDSGVFPKYYHDYIACIYYDGIWYEVDLSADSNGGTISVDILDKYKNNTHTSVSTLRFDFAYPTIQKYYLEAEQKRAEIARKKLEESDKTEDRGSKKE